MGCLAFVLRKPHNLEVAKVAVSVEILVIEFLQRFVKQATGWRPVRREVVPNQFLAIEGLLDRNRLLLAVPKGLSD